jgi:hypothetical protein
MADKTFPTIFPPLEAVDLGDGTHAVSVVRQNVPHGADLTYVNIKPPLRAVDLGDGTYAVSVVLK